MFRFLHLFSGHPRPGDLEDWLSKLGAERGVVVVAANADLGNGKHWDLTKAENLSKVLARARSG
eukprot:2211069-Alexandrium_andersonii.AAC.1